MGIPQITPTELRQLLFYVPSTGELFWKDRGIEWFTDKGRPAAANQLLWNAKYAGEPALTSIAANRYRTGRILGQAYKAHRVAWAVHYGAWPVNFIDHINGNRTDNRIGNLRDVTKAENARNQRLHSTNTSGVAGVSFKSDRNVWRARISIDGNMRTIGTFASFEDAVNARKAAEAALGYHDNHGVIR